MRDASELDRADPNQADGTLRSVGESVRYEGVYTLAARIMVERRLEHAAWRRLELGTDQIASAIARS